jgi:hypothetical protein
MPSKRTNLVVALSCCAIVSIVTGCAAPWTSPFSRTEPPKRVIAEPDPQPAVATVPATSLADANPNQADMASVMDKLEQVRAIDPSAEPLLIARLRQVPASSWPLVAEEFRASLAYHEQLADKDRTNAGNVQPVVDLRRASPYDPLLSSQTQQLVATGLAADHSGDGLDDRPSAPFGLLVDPHGANANGGVTVPRAPGSLATLTDVHSALSDARAPAPFAADGPTYPIDAVTRAKNDPNSRTTVATDDRHMVSQALAEVKDTPPRGPRSPDATSATDDENWQEAVRKAIADLERKVSPSPTTTAEVHQHVSLRMLRLLNGDTEKALEPIPHISATEQDYWSRQLFALATYLDHHSQPDDKRRAAASVVHLDEAVANLRELGSLSVRNLSFCKTVYGYGAIEPYDSDVFTPSQHVSLYVEVENYHSSSTEKGFTTSLGTSYEVLDDHGKRVTSGDFPDVNDCCRNRRRDFHMQLGLTLPENITPGRYQLQLVVKDRQSDKIGNAKAAFEIRGGKK